MNRRLIALPAAALLATGLLSACNDTTPSTGGSSGTMTEDSMSDDTMTEDSMSDDTMTDDTMTDDTMTDDTMTDDTTQGSDG